MSRQQLDLPSAGFILTSTERWNTRGLLCLYPQ
jgi:hypothetical protein